MAFDNGQTAVKGRARRGKAQNAGRRAQLAEGARGGRRGMVMRLAAGEVLFAPGDPKNDVVYRIRSGRLAVNGVLEAGEAGAAPERIYAAGEFAGLGFLDVHPATARALEALEVVVWGRADFERVAARVPDLFKLREEAVRLEYVWRRAQTVAEGRAARGENQSIS
jgi:hypothetical protein